MKEVPGAHEAAEYRYARSVLAASMLFMGACGIIYEYALSVLGNHLMGSSHEQIFVVIGLMLFAMGVGAGLQRFVRGALLDKFLALELLLGLVGGVSSIVIYTAFVYTASYQLVLYSGAFLVGVFIGVEIPLLIRINDEYAGDLKTNLADILCMDYVGSLLGALLFAYVLLTQLSLPRISLALGLVNTAVATIGTLYFWRLVRRPRLIVTSCGIVAAGLLACFAHADEWSASLEQRCFVDPIAHRETSRYQHIVLTQRDDNVKLYINGHLQFSSQDESIYHDMLVHVPMIAAPRRERVLILGGGDGLALREVLRYSDVETVTLVDIDPAIVRLASTHPQLVALNRGAFIDARVHTLSAAGIEPGETVTVTRPTKLARLLVDDVEYDLAQVRVIHLDADLFLRDVEERFDVALLDFPDPSTVELAKLYSVNFYRNLARRLESDAVLSVQSSSPWFAKRVFLCIGETLEAAGFGARPYHQNVPSFGEWGWHLAARSPAILESLDERLRDLAELPVPTAYVTPRLVSAAFAFGAGWLEDVRGVEPSTIMRPKILDYFREAWKIQR